MKRVKVIGLLIMISVSMNMLCNAQHAGVTVVVKEIKEAKGKIMIAIGNKSKPQSMIYNMVEVTTTNDVTCILENVPVGVCNLYVYQDLNENKQLDLDESNVPVEPCFTKKQVKVKEAGTTIEIKLINVKEMMGN